MSEIFSIYDSPLSTETKVLRRNALLSSGLCLFIGLTNELPKSFSLLGVSFTSSQQNILGWFLFGVTVYFLIHFISSAGVEVAKWIQPFIEAVLKKRKLLKTPYHDETDFIEGLPGEFNPNDEDSVHDHINFEAKWRTQKYLRYLYSFIYLKLILEILLPIIIGIYGVFKLYLFLSV